MKTIEVLHHFITFSEIETDEGIDYSLYQIQEGTEYLNPNVSNYGNSNFYYELVTEYNREFNDKNTKLGIVSCKFYGIS